MVVYYIRKLIRQLVPWDMFAGKGSGRRSRTAPEYGIKPYKHPDAGLQGGQSQNATGTATL